jgi:hypothetical protein
LSEASSENFSAAAAHVSRILLSLDFFRPFFIKEKRTPRSAGFFPALIFCVPFSSRKKGQYDQEKKEQAVPKNERHRKFWGSG